MDLFLRTPADLDRINHVHITLEGTSSMKDLMVRLRKLPRNVWAVSLTSFFMDISSEMVINILPLFLTNVLGVRTSVIGLIEGVAESTASVLKVFSGWISDKLKGANGSPSLAMGYPPFPNPSSILRIPGGG